MFQTKLMPWHIAQVRHSVVFWATLPMQISAWYWETWAEVYRVR